MCISIDKRLYDGRPSAVNNVKIGPNRNHETSLKVHGIALRTYVKFNGYNSRCNRMLIHKKYCFHPFFCCKIDGLSIRGEVCHPQSHFAYEIFRQTMMERIRNCRLVENNKNFCQIQRCYHRLSKQDTSVIKSIVKSIYREIVSREGNDHWDESILHMSLKYCFMIHFLRY